MNPIGVVTNPNSGKNRRNPGRCAELERALGRWGVVRETHDLAALERVLVEFFDLGADVWVCDGGDGTLHWMLTLGDRIASERGVPLPRIVPDWASTTSSTRAISPALTTTRSPWTSSSLRPGARIDSPHPREAVAR